jgi:hypothetical protein
MNIDVQVQNITNDNCADRMRATKDYLVIQCQSNGNLLILNKVNYDVVA